MAKNNQLAKSQNINAYLERPAVITRLSEKLGLEESKKFKAALSSALSTSPKLLECKPSTLINAALIGHSLNLPPSPQLGYYYLVPYKKKQKGNVPAHTEAVFQIGYKGYIQLAMRSGYYKKLIVSTVKEGEFVSWNPMTEHLEVKCQSDPHEREKAATHGYMGYFEYINGFQKKVYWTVEEVRIHADKYSKAYSAANHELLKQGKIPQKDLWKFSSFWYSDFDGMGLKTVIRQMLSKWGSMSVDMQTAYEQDIKTNSVPFDQAATDASTAINDGQGSEEINAEFEPTNNAPENSETKTDDDQEDFLKD